jgi:chromate transporter
LTAVVAAVALGMHPRGSVREVFTAFLGLGLTAFGGPVAHLAHFRRVLIEQRGWLDAPTYATLVGYCQFLPGPTSSQVGFLLGWHRAGIAGALAAWCAFTLPSALFLAGAALGAALLQPPAALLHGIELAVLAVIAQAAEGLARTLCPDGRRATIAAGVAAAGILGQAPWLPVAALAGAGLAGLLIPPAAQGSSAAGPVSPGPRTAATCFALLGLLGVLLAGLVMVDSPLARLTVACLQAGSLVFGGGHVVLPLLREPLVHGGFIGDQAFMAGYGAAQLVPGPLFTVSAWLGATVAGGIGALVAVPAIFAPGLLLALGGLRFYQRAQEQPRMRQVVAGLNAGVVGLLAAAAWQPVGHGLLAQPAAATLALLAYVALAHWRVPAALVIVGTAGAAWALGL